MTPLIQGVATRLCPLHAAQFAEATAQLLDAAAPSTLPTVLDGLRATCARACQQVGRDPFAYSSPLSPFQQGAPA
jgi:hypothetical protein